MVLPDAVQEFVGQLRGAAEHFGGSSHEDVPADEGTARAVTVRAGEPDATSVRGATIVGDQVDVGRRGDVPEGLQNYVHGDTGFDQAALGRGRTSHGGES